MTVIRTLLISIGIVIGTLVLLIGCGADNNGVEKNMATVTHINPEGMHRNPAFTQMISVEGPHRTLYIGGQNAVSAEGEIVGKGDISAQAQQVFQNLQTALAAGGASLENVVKWNVYVLQGQPAQPAIQVFQEVWGRRPNPPTICVITVAGLAHPDFLLEMDAIAVVPIE